MSRINRCRRGEAAGRSDAVVFFLRVAVEACATVMFCLS